MFEYFLKNTFFKNCREASHSLCNNNCWSLKQDETAIFAKNLDTSDFQESLYTDSRISGESCNMFKKSASLSVNLAAFQSAFTGSVGLRSAKLSRSSSRASVSSFTESSAALNDFLTGLAVFKEGVSSSSSSAFSSASSSFSTSSSSSSSSSSSLTSASTGGTLKASKGFIL